MKESKYEPDVDLVDLLEINPQYALIRHPDGREDTVALRNLAPYPRGEEVQEDKNDPATDMQPPTDVQSSSEAANTTSNSNDDAQVGLDPGPRRPIRVKKPVEKLNL